MTPYSTADNLNSEHSDSSQSHSEKTELDQLLSSLRLPLKAEASEQNEKHVKNAQRLNNRATEEKLASEKPTGEKLTMADFLKKESDESELENTPKSTVCPQCEVESEWAGASFCPSCGYYPTLGKTVEVVQSIGEPEETKVTYATAIPKWGWVLGGGVIAIFAYSALIHSMIKDSAFQGDWAIGQATCGMMCLLISHFYAYTKIARTTDQIGFGEMIIKPFSIWKRIAYSVPETAPNIWSASWSSALIVSALVVIGGIDYWAITDLYAVKKAPDKNLIAAVAKYEHNDKKQVEESLSQLAVLTETKVLGKTKRQINQEKTHPLKKECVIIGYTQNTAGQIESLVLAGINNETLQYMGTVSATEIPAKMLTEFQSRAKSLKQDKPFIQAPVAAQWIKPELTCRVRYAVTDVKKHLVDPIFNAFLGDL